MSPAQANFNEQYGGTCKDVFRGIVTEELEHGGDAAQRARDYAERGKPDFALAFLLAAALPDEEKRDLYARSFERRATLTEERAREFDRTFHRSFAMLFTEASKDRAAAQRIRAGRLQRLARGGHCACSERHLSAN